MSKAAIKRYAPFYIALLVTGIVMVLLFLRPESALGLTVEVDAVKKFEGFPAGFKLLDPNTDQPETVVINAEVSLAELEFGRVTSATLGIETRSSSFSASLDDGSGSPTAATGIFTLNAARTELAVSITLVNPSEFADYFAADFTNAARKLVWTLGFDHALLDAGDTATGTWKSTDSDFPLTDALVAELEAGTLHMFLVGDDIVEGQILQVLTDFKDFGTGKAFPAVDLPLPVAPTYAPVSAELTEFLPKVNGSTQGKLVVDTELVQLSPDAFGYGYGYRGQRGGGKIKFTIRYIPPEIAGTYKATVTAFFDDSATSRSPLAVNTTEFKVVPPIVSGDVKAVDTAYPRSETEALSRDLVVVQAKVKSDIAPNVVSVTVDPGILGPAPQEMDRNSAFHQALMEKWQIATNDPGYVNYSLPMKIVPQAEPLTCQVCEATIKVVDIAGQEVNLSGSNGAKVNVVATRQQFNVYLMPGLNFVSTPLQCSGVAPKCKGDDGQSLEFDIATLLDQPVNNAATGNTLADVVSTIFYYCAKSTDTSCPKTGGTEPVSEVKRRPKPPSVDSRFRGNNEILSCITHQCIVLKSEIVMTVLA